MIHTLHVGHQQTPWTTLHVFRQRVERLQDPTEADRWPQPLAQAKRNVGGKDTEEKQKTEATISQGNCVPGEEKTELLPAE